VQVALQLVPTPEPPALDADADADAEDAHAPKSTDNLDWHDMAARVTNASLSLGKYRMAIFFSNDETDTQGGIWWRPAAKEIMIIFRGACVRACVRVCGVACGLCVRALEWSGVEWSEVKKSVGASVNRCARIMV
jgi:hypothetical protein